jgi:dTDP-4-amino-4,6-dideoxygalactose transaminase
MIPFSDSSASYHSHKDEIDQAITRVLDSGSDDLPVTDAFYKRHLTLPMFPELPEESVEWITKCTRDWFAKR